LDQRPGSTSSARLSLGRSAAIIGRCPTHLAPGQRQLRPRAPRRLEAVTAWIRRLGPDDRQPHDALARALGERRAADVLGTGAQRDTPKRGPAKVIGPC
jgi:hypothetical protein